MFMKNSEKKIRFHHFASILILGLVASTAALAEGEFLGGNSDQIIGGKEVSASDPIAATTVAIVNKTPEGTALCTGSIVAKDLVITAGHCVGPKKENMRVAFRTKLSGTGPVMSIKGYVRHPDYDDNGGTNDKNMNDIALIRIDGVLPEGYNTAKLLGNSADLTDGRDVTLAGYGITSGARATGVRKNASTSDDDGAGTLRKVDIAIKQARYSETEVLLDQTHGKGACHGDSGGPAFLTQNGDLLLFGVTSRGAQETRTGECSGSVIYTNILAHAAFLKSAAAALKKL
jgi:secreted trypsin-like serine protease